MKLEIKLGIYAITSIIMILVGLSVLLYPFEFYSLESEELDIYIVLGTIATKAIGITMFWIGSKIQRKHFKFN